MRFLLNNIDSKVHQDKECVLNALSYLLRHNKEKAMKFVTSEDDLVYNWLACAELKDESLRECLFNSLASLLFVSDEEDENMNK